MAQLSLSCRRGKKGNTLVFPSMSWTRCPPCCPDARRYVQSARCARHPRFRQACDHWPLHRATTDGPSRGDAGDPARTSRLPQGGTFEGRVELTLLLAETSPYFADLTLRQYEVVTINGIVFTIGFWVAGEDGLAAAMRLRFRPAHCGDTRHSSLLPPHIATFSGPRTAIVPPHRRLLAHSRRRGRSGDDGRRTAGVAHHRAGVTIRTQRSGRLSMSA